MAHHGTLAGIYVTPAAAAPMAPVTAVQAVAGTGLEGDRYADGSGTYSSGDRYWGQVTLIEEEALAAVEREAGIPLDAAETRRNLVTSGVALNHLVDRTFRVGDATLRGTKLCEPCAHMERLAGKPVRKPLVHRGGLNAVIVTGGTLRLGDPIRPEEDQ